MGIIIIGDYMKDYMEKDIVLSFGKFKGCTLQEIPENYLFWLCNRGKSMYYESDHSLEITFKVPFNIWELARLEADRRGWTKIGERWEKK